MEFNSDMECIGMVWFGLVGKRKGEESAKSQAFWSEAKEPTIGLD
jgi:hypothetical protein